MTEKEKKRSSKLHNLLLGITTSHVLLLFGIVGLGSIGLYAYSIDGVYLAELFLFAISSTIFGALIGFLFGIPKMGKSRSDGRMRANTNLEEISDWLTKIIVGLGLAQLPEIRDSIIAIVESISADIPAFPKSIVLALLIYFVLYGFFFSYLNTRIYLGLIFAESDERVAAAQAAVKGATANLGDFVAHQDEELIKK